ncbi:MAG: heavy-metal-associated domain-containing protein [Nitrospirae bacterium]|nr:heavy-metal-associated domain-containing protein [Nitrospirota bacterium]
MNEISLTIGGMSCGHCVMRVKKAIEGLSGVSSSDVNVGSATVQYDEAKISKEDIVSTIEKAGYTIK